MALAVMAITGDPDAARGALCFAQRRRRLQPVEHRHLHVHQHQVEPSRRRIASTACGAVTRHDYPVSRVLQHPHREQLIHRVVFRQKDVESACPAGGPGRKRLLALPAGVPD